MARLLYSAIASLDGYVVDASGSFRWAAPSEEVHAFVNERERPLGTYLYGRRMYEVMRYWAQDGADDSSAISADYRRIWQAADKVVFSRSLAEVDTPRTELVRELDPDDLRHRKDTAAADLAIGGPTLAAEALRAGLVDEVSLYLHPISVGGGTPALPLGLRVDLDLVEQHTFGDGVVFLRYQVVGGA
ncbi:dihydrofolate reductase [Phycicoccus badiiscoriae]|uniref:Dihydrofolate reductase n=1 Tax=Pedococcus badiiscoriae TaxID=642776 RepID=A0A852WH43_9MICO|nr:dihydrofolate reductase family protein [Pedococcus badiiscoriae]NYG08537.1 dihydrofolate reductase [Pedococcus badiiscoriae]